MKFVHSQLADLNSIMKIIGDAQLYLASLDINQWQDGYPNENQIKQDIQNNDSYIIINDEDVAIGTTVFTFKEELTYRKIEGSWITNQNECYGVIHRLAVDNDYRKIGLAKFVFDTCEELVKTHTYANSLRIDTHKDNKGMQLLLNRRGYQYCGIITLESGDERLAFEKLI